MRNISTKSLFLLPLIALLGACSSVPDLLDPNSSLRITHRKVAQEMAAKALVDCVAASYNDEETGERMAYFDRRSKTPILETDDDERIYYKPLHSTPVVTKFLMSKGGWYQADLMIDGLWDSVYYKPSEKRFTCGQSNWKKSAAARTVKFAEPTAKGSSTTTTTPAPSQPKQPNQSRP